jgi:queuine tRNA-ribosyltransferase
MHSSNDPHQEARELYVEQSALAQKLKNSDAHEIVVWDVGLGAAINAMAALKTAEAPDSIRPLRLVSFENDLDPLRLVLRFTSHFEHVRHPAPHQLLKNKTWTSPDGRIHWSLLEGNFLEALAHAPTPDVIFYDPFSFKTNPECWTAACFEQILTRCEGRATELFTYPPRPLYVPHF